MLWWCLAYLAGCLVSAGVFAAMGQQNTSTTDGSVTGDATLEIACIVAWPAFWPAYLAYRIARWWSS